MRENSCFASLRRRPILTLLLLATLPVGCGDDRPLRYPVSGQVLIDGKPLTVGFVMMHAEHARPATGRLGPDGRFTLTCFAHEDGSVPGTHVVTVSAVGLMDDDHRKWFAPQKYADPRTSGLEATITEATDDLKIELSWNGGAPFVDGP